MGISISAVAVFDNHIERNPVAIINPSTKRCGCPPIIRNIFNAILLCRFHFSTATARIKPPMNSRMIQSIYWLATLGKIISKSVALNPSENEAFSRFMRLPAGNSRPRMIPKRGNNIIGSSAVADRGIASVIHQMAINRITAAIRVTKGLAGSSSTKSIIEIKTSGPSQSPILLLIGVSAGTKFSSVAVLIIFIVLTAYGILEYFI